MKPFLEAWERCTPATRLSLVAVCAAIVNTWLGLSIGVCAAWMYTQKQPLDFSRHLALWYFLPVAAALGFLGVGESTPPDDLLRHITAWRIGLDYRTQYPWSDIPKANLWLGFDYLLGALQRAGVSKDMLLQWVPGVSLALQSVVLFGILRRILPARRVHAELFLLAGALGMLALTPRSLLGRPEMFLLIFGMSAGLCRTRLQAAVWFAGYMLLIPFYWLGWVYAPLALLLAPAAIPLRARFGIGAVLGLLHVAFWQVYTGDYLGLLIWLRGTLSILVGENAPMLCGLSFWGFWLLMGSLGLVLSSLNKRRAIAALPVILLLVWFTLPNQLRYFAALSFVALPWVYRNFALMARLKHIRIPSMVVLLALGLAGAVSIPKTDEQPKFDLGAHARVYSDAPYATVFYGQPGIAVEPSFAMGATRPEWKDLRKGDVLSCDLLVRGGFTHVVEKTLHQSLDCAELKAVQGPWRLWAIKKG